MKNNATRTIRSEKITIDVRICVALAANRGGEVLNLRATPLIIKCLVIKSFSAVSP